MTTCQNSFVIPSLLRLTIVHCLLEKGIQFTLQHCTNQKFDGILCIKTSEYARKFLSNIEFHESIVVLKALESKLTKRLIKIRKLSHFASKRGKMTFSSNIQRISAHIIVNIDSKCLKRSMKSGTAIFCKVSLKR